MRMSWVVTRSLQISQSACAHITSITNLTSDTTRLLEVRNKGSGVDHRLLHPRAIKGQACRTKSRERLLETAATGVCMILCVYTLAIVSMHRILRSPVTSSSMWDMQPCQSNGMNRADRTMFAAVSVTVATTCDVGILYSSSICKSFAATVGPSWLPGKAEQSRDRFTSCHAWFM